MAAKVEAESNLDSKEELPADMSHILRDWISSAKPAHPLDWVGTSRIHKQPTLPCSLCVLGPIVIGNATDTLTFTLTKPPNLLHRLRQEHCVWEFRINDGSFYRGAPATIKPKQTVIMFFMTRQYELSQKLTYESSSHGSFTHQIAALTDSVPTLSVKFFVNATEGLFVGSYGDVWNTVVNDKPGTACVPLPAQLLI
jgi:hypothetical protein